MTKINSNFFTNNRNQLIKQLQGYVVVIPAHSLMQYSADVAYPFRQDSNFWYLTGINEPDMVLVIDADSAESTLLLPDLNDYQKEWDGDLDKKTLQKTSGINEIRFKADLKRILKLAVSMGKKIGYLEPLADIVEPYGFYSNPARKLLELELKKALHRVGPGAKKGGELVDVRMELARLRMVKQPEEIEAIRKAVDITANSMAEVKKKLQSFKTEKELERALLIEFLRHGADGHGFDPIIASGKNAATIHYEKNSSVLKQNELALLDIGARVGMYPADISRVWQIGNASDRQKEVYAALHDLQEEAFDLVKPGKTIKEIHKEHDKMLKATCKKIKISERKLPHGLSHYLGIDVHDSGDYDAPLQPGMVLTVEPGIYLPEEGIGVRIEDEVLIADKGIEILSKNISKTL